MKDDDEEKIYYPIDDSEIAKTTDPRIQKILKTNGKVNNREYNNLRKEPHLLI